MPYSSVVLGSPGRDQSIFSFYFGGGPPTKLYADVLSRPQHYTEEQRELVEALYTGREPRKPPKPEELNELVYRFVEPQENRKKREEVIQRLQDLDPAVQRRIDAQKAAETFENQQFPGAIVVL